MSYPTQRYTAERPDGHTLDGTPGDCFAACIAVLLDVDLEQIPHFVMHGDHWWDVTRRTVRELRPGWDLTCAMPSPWPPYLGDVEEWVECQHLAIATGPSPRGGFMHCVVIDTVTGEMVWDPHPSRAGLAGDIVELDLLVTAYDPAPADPIALPPAPPTALERVAAMQAAGAVRLCRQTKPISEHEAQLIADFADELARRSS